MRARRLVPLLASLAIGFALGWLVREGTRSPPTDAVRYGAAPSAPTLLPEDRPPSRPDPSASLGAAGMRSVGSEPPPAPVNAEGAASQADAAGSALPFIELTVVAGPGTPPDWKATAYLVAAGAKGARKPEELPHAEVSVDRPVRLVAPAVDLYDLGIVNVGMQLLETDVRATAEGTRVRVTLPAMAPVRFRLSNAIPPDEPNVDVTGFVHLQREGESSGWNDLPGRGQIRRGGPMVMVEGGAGTEFETPAILAGEPFTLDPAMRETHREGQSTLFTFSARWELTAEPRVVRGGDVVTLTVVPLGTLKLALTGDPSTWTKFPARPSVGFHRDSDGAYHGMSDRLDGRDAAVAWLAEGIRRPLGPGRWTVTWEGPGWAPGRLEGVLAEKQAWSVYARRDDTWPFTQRGTGPTPPEVSADLRGRRAVLVVGEDRVSATEEVPAAGPWRPRLLRAGFVMCALRTLDPSLGVVTATRTDGLPVALYRERRYVREFRPELEATLAPGLILGPFAPGPLELEVFAARKSLGVVKLTIEAGVVVPLSIPGR